MHRHGGRRLARSHVLRRTRGGQLERSRFRRFILPAGLDVCWRGGQRFHSASGCRLLLNVDVFIRTTYPRSLSCLLYVLENPLPDSVPACPVPNNDYHYTCSAVRTKLDDQELAAS